MPVVEVDLGVSAVPAGGTLAASGPGITDLETSIGVDGGGVDVGVSVIGGTVEDKAGDCAILVAASGVIGGTLEASGPGIAVLGISAGAGVDVGAGGGIASKVGGILGLDSLFGSESTDILVLAEASGASTGLDAFIVLSGTAAGTSIGFSPPIGAVGAGGTVEVGNAGGGVEDKTGD